MSRPTFLEYADARVRGMDRAIIESVFQPMHDLVSQLRQRSDHALAVAFVLASGCVFTFKHFVVRHDVVDAFDWGMVSASWVAILLVAVMLHVYGAMARNSGRPGLFANSAWARTLIFLLPLASDFSLFLVTLDAHWAWNALDDMVTAAAWYFGGVTLKRPPPPKPVEQWVLAPQGA